MKDMLEGRRTAHASGRHASGPAPFGYRIRSCRKGEGLGKTLEPLEPQAGVVRALYVMVAAGATTKRVAAVLTRHGVATVTGRPSWADTTVGKMVRSPVYLGFVGFEHDWVKGIHEPLVSEALWAAAQRAVASRRCKPRTKPYYEPPAPGG